MGEDHLADEAVTRPSDKPRGRRRVVRSAKRPSAHELGLMSAVRACERDIADAALLAAAGPEAAAVRAGTLALRAFASHPLVGSLAAARALAAAVLPTTPHHS